MTRDDDIEVGDKFISRRGTNIAVVVYLSVNGDVGYRLKWSRRVRHSTRRNFERNYTPINEGQLETEVRQ